MTEKNVLVPPVRKLLDVNRVKDAPYNPNRTRLSRHALRPLVESMSRYGQLYPVLVDGNNVLIEGHRRTAAARELGWETIEAIVVDGHDREAVFVSVNESQRKMTGNESLFVFLANPRAVTGKQEKKFREMLEVLGKELTQEVVQQGYSWSIFDRAKRVCRYVSKDDAQYVQKVTQWLLHVVPVMAAQNAIRTGYSPAKMREAIAHGKGLPNSLSSTL